MYGTSAGNARAGLSLDTVNETIRIPILRPSALGASSIIVRANANGFTWNCPQIRCLCEGPSDEFIRLKNEGHSDEENFDRG